MRKVYKFSKFFLPAVILSAVIIIAGVVCVAVRGVNFGLDFKSGMVEEIKIAPTALELSYRGTANVNVNFSSTKVDFVISGVGEENRTETYLYSEVQTVSDLAAKALAIEGVSAEVKKGSAKTETLFVKSTVSTTLGETPLKVYANDNSVANSIDDVRDALKSMDKVEVKAVGSGSDANYQIRIGFKDEEGDKNVQSAANQALDAKFGADNVAVMKSDLISAQFSGSLIKNSVILVLATLILIFIYATFRFKWDFAFAAVVAIIHDSFIMVAFIAFSQMEFSTTTLAAILTIIGYSINATVVILDRIRYDIKVVEAKSFVEILNAALTETLGRSIITTVTTLFAVISLAVFTTGTIHDFAVALIVGLISGCYSSIFIAGAFIAYVRRNYIFETAKIAPNVRKFEEEN